MPSNRTWKPRGHYPHPCPLPTRGRETPTSLSQMKSSKFAPCGAGAKSPSPLWGGVRGGGISICDRPPPRQARKAARPALSLPLEGGSGRRGWGELAQGRALRLEALHVQQQEFPFPRADDLHEGLELGPLDRRVGGGEGPAEQFGQRLVLLEQFHRLQQT